MSTERRIVLLDLRRKRAQIEANSIRDTTIGAADRRVRAQALRRRLRPPNKRESDRPSGWQSTARATAEENASEGRQPLRHTCRQPNRTSRLLQCVLQVR